MPFEPKSNLSLDEKINLVLAEISAIKGFSQNHASVALSLHEAMLVTGHKSTSSWFRWCEKSGLKPFRRGWYRRFDIENAMAKGVYG